MLESGIMDLGAMPQDVWHEVTVAPYIDPTTGHASLLITQSDATGRAETEAALSRLNEVGGLGLTACKTLLTCWHV